MRAIAVGILLGLTAAFVGCASWLPRDETLFYAGAEGLRVHAQASARSAVIGHLGLHERVQRSQVERGFAHVRSERSGVVGWVDNAKLLTRIPAPQAPAAAPRAAPEPPAASDAVAVPTGTEPAATEVAPADPTPAQPAAEPASAESTPATPPPPDPPRREPAVFDPF